MPPPLSKMSLTYTLHRIFVVHILPCLVFCVWFCLFGASCWFPPRRRHPGGELTASWTLLTRRSLCFLWGSGISCLDFPYASERKVVRLWVASGFGGLSPAFPDKIAPPSLVSRPVGALGCCIACLTPWVVVVVFLSLLGDLWFGSDYAFRGAWREGRREAET